MIKIEIEIEIDKREIEILKTIGSKLRYARNLCKLTLPEAAKLLECDFRYLQAVENARNDAIPFNFIARASNIYDVPTDFLLGLTADEWESDPVIRNERNIIQWVHESHAAQLSELLIENKLYHHQINVLGEITKAICDNFTHTESALDRFIEVNPEFIDMQCGSPLLSQVERLKTLAIQLNVRCKKLKLPPFSQDFYRRKVTNNEPNY